MMIVGILMKNIPYNIGQFGILECDDRVIQLTPSMIWMTLTKTLHGKKSNDDAFADDHYSEKRSVIHIDNITHGHVNINMTNASLISPRVTPAMVTRWTPSSHLQESGHRGSQHPLPGDSPAQRRPRVHVRVPPDSL